MFFYHFSEIQERTAKRKSDFKKIPLDCEIKSFILSIRGLVI